MKYYIYDSTGTLVASGDTSGGGGGGGTVPNNVTANSLAIAPVAGEPQASSISQKNGSGTQVFGSDASGNVTVAGTLAVAGASTMAAVNAASLSSSGALNVTGASTVAALSAASIGTTGNVAVGGTLNVTGTSTVQTLNTGAITATGLLKAPNVTLNTGGVITFGDGTTINTAAAASGVPSRAVIFAGTNSVLNNPANNYQNTYFYYSTGNTGNVGFVYRFPFPGAVVGISLVNTASQTLANYIQFMKNGTNFNSPYNLGIASGPGSSIPAYVWNKTLNPYAAGDVLTFGIANTVTSNLTTEVYLVIEHTA